MLSSAATGLPRPLRQWVLGTAYAMVPRRLPGVIPMVVLSVREMLRGDGKPHPERALANPDGLCGISSDITVDGMMAGYSLGAFLMSHVGPLKWWAPKRRMVLFFDGTRVEKTTRRLLRSGKFQVTFDTAFCRVLRECAAPRAGAVPLTWITPRTIELLEAAHLAGHAHSVEVWEEGRLVGGAFGVAAGKVFQTESQFHTVKNASKVGFAVLNRHLQAWGFAANDGRHPTRYLADAGMTPITRDEFCVISRRYSGEDSRPGKWQVEDELLGDGWIPAESPGLTMNDVLPGGTAAPETVDELLTTKRSPTW